MNTCLLVQSAGANWEDCGDRGSVADLLSAHADIFIHRSTVSKMLPDADMCSRAMEGPPLITEPSPPECIQRQKTLDFHLDGGALTLANATTWEQNSCIQGPVTL